LQAEERWKFEQITMPHFDAAYNLARWLTSDAHAAEDVVQEAYLRAARYFSSFRGGDGRKWLLGVVRRASLDWLAKRKSQPAVVLGDDVHEAVDVSSDPVIEAERKFDQQRVREAIAELPQQYREVVVLRELEGMSYQEIAAVIEAPIGTVMSRLARGRECLQVRLRPPANG
jgi:RNA polymerase sigma-70 factor (ECF subfamily)